MDDCCYFCSGSNFDFVVDIIYYCGVFVEEMREEFVSNCLEM